MNNKLPYEQQIEDQLMDLPLPDENAAWEDMRKRLEEEDDDSIIPIWLRGCGLWGLIGIIILAVGLLFIFSPSKNNKKNKTEPISITSDNDKNEKTKQKFPFKDTSSLNNNIDNSKNVTSTITDSNKDNKKINGSAITGKHSLNKVKDLPEKTNDPVLKVINNKKHKDVVRPGNINPQPAKNITLKNNDQKNIPRNNNDRDLSASEILTNNRNTDTTGAMIKRQNDELSSTVSVPMQNNPLTNADSISTNKKDSANKKEVSDTNLSDKNKKDSAKNEKIFFSAGLGLQQQIPINGQKLVPYSSLGRNNILSDYIPSVYFQATKPNKWFAYIGFRYGAPQFNKEFAFNQHIVTDTVGSVISTTTSSLTLKKTFYHQLPLSFNYQILPKWSAGAGVVWNKFYGAVADHELSKRTGSSDSVLKKEIVSFKSDSTSSISKSYFQVLIETQYNWKRFYFGARYSFGLQPYIKFTLPGGTEQREKNGSLQVFIRYDLWRSKKK